MGFSVSKGQGLNLITWTMWPDVTVADIPLSINNKYENVGVKQFDFQATTTISFKGANERTNLLALLIHLWPGDWNTQVSCLNSAIDRKMMRMQQKYK